MPLAHAFTLGIHKCSYLMPNLLVKNEMGRDSFKDAIIIIRIM